MKTTRKLILLLAHILEVFSTYIPAVTSPEKEGVSTVGEVGRWIWTEAIDFVSYKDGCWQPSSIVVSVLDSLITGRIVNVVICLSVCFRSSGRLRLYPLVDFDKLLWCFGWVWQMTNQNQEDSSAGRSSRKLQVCTPGASLRARDRDKSGHFSLHTLPLWHSIFVLESRMCQPTQATSFSQRYHRTYKATKPCTNRQNPFERESKGKAWCYEISSWHQYRVVVMMFSSLKSKLMSSPAEDDFVFYICLQWKGFELILEVSILFFHLHKIGAQFPCRQHLRALIYSHSTSILHNKPLLCECSYLIQSGNNCHIWQSRNWVDCHIYDNLVIIVIYDILETD